MTPQQALRSSDLCDPSPADWHPGDDAPSREMQRLHVLLDAWQSPHGAFRGPMSWPDGAAAAAAVSTSDASTRPICGSVEDSGEPRGERGSGPHSGALVGGAKTLYITTAMLRGPHVVRKKGVCRTCRPLGCAFCGYGGRRMILPLM